MPRRVRMAASSSCRGGSAPQLRKMRHGAVGNVAPGLEGLLPTAPRSDLLGRTRQAASTPAGGFTCRATARFRLDQLAVEAQLHCGHGRGCGSVCGHGKLREIGSILRCGAYGPNAGTRAAGNRAEAHGVHRLTPGEDEGCGSENQPPARAKSPDPRGSGWQGRA